MIMLRWLLRLDGQLEFTSTVISYTQVYVFHLSLALILSAVTVFRREMSCNRVFHKDNSAIRSPSNHIDISKETDGDWDDLLDGAEKWGSGKPFLEFVAILWHKLWNGRLETFRISWKAQQESWTEQMSETLLDGAGLSFSGLPFRERFWTSRNTNHRQLHYKGTQRIESFSFSHLMNRLSSDLYVHIFSFLHPKDLTTLACCNKETWSMVSSEENEISRNLWKALWDRDYSWLIESWDIGIIARKRCFSQSTAVNQQLYFEFGLTFIDFLLAGQNSTERCLVGLHGSVFDITEFLTVHPGSIETILVHAGRDATSYFEDIGHSYFARNLAQTMCVVVDLSCIEKHGFGTSKGSYILNYDDKRLIPLKRSRMRNPKTLHRIWSTLSKSKEKALREISQVVNHRDIHLYYDAFDRKWKAWFINETLENEFVV
jgi:cytochrome b involved in lipid metabolism